MFFCLNGRHNIQHNDILYNDNRDTECCNAQWHYSICLLHWLSLMLFFALIDLYAGCPLHWVSFILSMIYAVINAAIYAVICAVIYVVIYAVIYAECCILYSNAKSHSILCCYVLWRYHQSRGTILILALLQTDLQMFSQRNALAYCTKVGTMTTQKVCQHWDLASIGEHNVLVAAQAQFSQKNSSLK